MILDSRKETYASKTTPKMLQNHLKSSSERRLRSTSFSDPFFLDSPGHETSIFELSPTRELDFQKITVFRNVLKTVPKSSEKESQIHQTPLIKRIRKKDRKNNGQLVANGSQRAPRNGAMAPKNGASELLFPLVGRSRDVPGP